MEGLLSQFGFPGANSNANVVEEEETNDGGTPIPPGFVHEPKNFSTPEGKQEVLDKTEELGNGIVYTPITTGFMGIIQLFMFGSSIYFASSTIYNLLGSAFGSIIDAFSSNCRLNTQNRAYMIAIGFGLILFVLWRINSMGLIGGGTVEQIIDMPPVFFDII